MATPFIGEIKVVGFNFPPREFAFCDGQLLPISQYSALFAILGTSYGGNGSTTFGLPNLQGIAPMNWGNGPALTPRTIGEALGSATVTLTDAQMPSHTHILNGGNATPANAAQSVARPTSQAMFSTSGPGRAYSDVATPPVTLAPTAIGPTGGSLPHENMQPVLALNFVIALNGIFPSRN
jgi:microcystin-dependent protein